MPCSDDGPSFSDYTEAKKKLDKLTDLLCTTCKTLSESTITKVPGLQAWWINHQEEDRKRAEREAARRQKELEQAALELKRAKRKLKQLQKK